MSPLSGRLARASMLLYGAMALGFAVVVVRRLFDPQAIAGTDFTAFFTGWWLVLHGRGGELYDVAAQQAAQHAIVGDFEFHGGLLAFLHPPHAALAGLPLGFVADRFGEPAAFWLWTAANVALAAVLVRGLGRLASGGDKPGRWLVGTAVLAYFPTFVAMREGQLAILLAVALLGLYRAVRDGRDAAAAAWLLILSAKPQLLPVPLALLAGLGRIRVLAFGAAFGGVAAGLAALVLGPGIFASYWRGLGALQQHLGNGTPGGMVNARGLLVRLTGASSLGSQSVAFAICLAAAVGVATLVARRRPGRADAPGLARAFALAYAATLFFSPHLFVPDLAMWAVPLALAASALQRGTPELDRLARFALAWPIVAAATLAAAGWPRLYLETATLLSAAALVLVLRISVTAPGARETAPAGR